MRLKIFWRVILAQVVLIILILMVSLYALFQLNWLTRLSTNILTIDASAIEEEKQLLRIFLTQMRHAEKYLLLKDNAFYNRFVQSQGDFESTLAQVATLLDTSAENVRLTQIRTQHAHYGAILSHELRTPLTGIQEGTVLLLEDTPDPITISADIQPTSNGQRPFMEIKVSDTGVGIVASEVERIFDRFYPSPEGRGANSHGTGLGLAIARHIVEAHGGKIWAENRVGEGATFVFTLPLYDSAKMANVELAAHWNGVQDAG